MERAEPAVVLPTAEEQSRPSVFVQNHPCSIAWGQKTWRKMAATTREFDACIASADENWDLIKVDRLRDWNGAWSGGWIEL